MPIPRHIGDRDGERTAIARTVERERAASSEGRATSGEHNREQRSRAPSPSIRRRIDAHVRAQPERGGVAIG